MRLIDNPCLKGSLKELAHYKFLVDFSNHTGSFVRSDNYYIYKVDCEHTIT